MHSSISGMMPLKPKYYNNIQQEYDASPNIMPRSLLSSSTLFQQLFRIPQLRKNQKTNSSLNENNKRLQLSRNKRVHGLSLLRTFGLKPSHVLTYINGENNARILSRKKRVHSLSLLRTFSAKPSYNNLRNNIENEKNRQRRGLYNLSVLRSFDIKKLPALFQDYEFEENNKNYQKEKRLHSLSLLRDCNGKILCQNNNLYKKHQRVRRRTKRVHNLSLLRYDGKLFQNLFAPNVETNLLSDQDLENQRFEQKRFSMLLNKLKNKQKNNLPTYYFY